MIAPEHAKLMVLAILGERRMRYADVLAEYGRRVGLGGEQAAGEFARLVQGLIAEKLIDYQADPGGAGPAPPISMLWLRPRGKARLREGGPREGD